MNYFNKLKKIIFALTIILSIGSFLNTASAGYDDVTVVVTIPSYTVSTYIASGSGSFSPTSRTVTSGTQAVFTVTPSSGYYISSISGCGGSLSGSTYTTGSITSNCTVTVNFTYNPYLTVNKAGTGNGTYGTSGYYGYGSTQTAWATPDSCSTFTGWTGDCNSSGQVTMYGARTCTANFALKSHSLSVTTSGSGSASGAGTYNCGQTATVTPSPSSCWYHAGFGGDCNSSGQVYMNGNKSCTVSFGIYTYYLTVNTAGNGGGSVGGAGTYNCGTGVTATATPNANSVFSGWSGDCDSNGYVVMGGARTCTANFTARSNITSLSASPNPIPLTGATTISYACTNGYYSHIRLNDKWSSEGGWDYSGYYGSTSVTTPAFNTSGVHKISAYCYNSTWTPSTNSWYNIYVTVNPPATPSGFGVGASSQGNNWLNLWWNASAGATSYQVYRGGTLVYDGAGTSFSDTGLTFGGTYSYTIKATNNGVSSALSGTIYGTVANAPNPSTDLKVSAWSGSNLDGSTETYGGDTYTLSWPAISNASSCTLDGSGVAVSGGSTTRTASNRSATHTLTCTNSTGQSVSDSVTVTTPPVPTGYYFGCSADAMTATAYWTAPSGYNTFYTRATRRSDGAYVLNNDGATGTSNSFSIAPNTNYDYWMHTRNPSNGAWSYSTGGLINCPRYGTLIYNAGTGGSVSGATTQTIPYGGSGTQVTAVPASGYTFSSWSDGVTSASRTDTNVTANKTVTANFVDSIAPSAPGSLTTSWTRDRFVNGPFTASTSGSSDAGTGIRGYWLCRSSDNTGGCYYEVYGGEQASTSRTVSGDDLPSPGAYRYYYWYARDNAGNQSTNSPDIYVRMDGAAPVYNSTWFEGCNYESGNNCYVKNGTTFYTFVSHSDNSPGVQSGTNRQYLEFSKDGANRGTWDGSVGNIKSYAEPYGVSQNSYYYSFADGLTNDTYMDIVDAQCVQPGGCNSTAVGKWKVVAGSGPSTMYGVTVFMYDGMWNGVGYTTTPKYVYLDNTAPTTPTPTDAGANQASTSIVFNADPTDAYSGISTCYAQVDVNNTDGAGLAMGTTDVGADGDHTFTGSAGNTYYYRYYCTDRVGNSSGWSAWSDGVAINIAPSISSPAHSSVSLTSATLGATITSAGIPSSITERGTCWGTSGSPTTNCAAEGGTSVSAFSHSRGGLSPSTTYYYRGYAKNASGTTYSADGSFTTGAVTISGVSATTSYNTTVGASVSFAYTTPTTNISSVQCQLLDNASNALTSYSTANPIVYTAPSSPGSFGYYIRCRNATYTGTTSTSSLITVNIPSPTGSISASPSSCTISIGGSSCSTTISWSTTNPVNTSTVVSGGSTLYTANSGSQSVSVPYSSRTFTLHNNGAQIGTVSPTSSCASGSTWNSTSGTCARNSYTVSTSAGTGGSISPTSASVAHGSTTTFTVTPNTGYAISSVTGCGGTRSGNSYTTADITAACIVSATFTINSYTVSTATGTGGTITPTSRSVSHGSTTTFTVGATAGYAIQSISNITNNCGYTGATLVGSTYTTGAITGACTVTVNPTFVMSGTLTSSASSCTITAGNSSCSVDLTWTTSNPIGTSAVTASGMTDLTGNSGTSIAVTVPYNTRTFYLYNSGFQLASRTVTASCASGSVWNGSICLQQYSVSVTKAGTGTGTVTSSPAGINCGSTCSYSYGSGSSVVLTATPGSDGNLFTGWSGACSGTSTCSLTVNAAKSVTATFNSVGVTVTPTTTTYYTARSANNTFGFTSSTSTGTTECRLLNSSSTALTSYAAGTSITYGMPATAGAYGYYIQCRNVAYPTKIASSSLITVNVVTVGVTATTTYNTTPGSTVSFVYTPNATAGSSECALLNSSQTAITSFQASSPISYTIPNNTGAYGYYVRCRHTIATTEIATSALITVNSACSTGTSWNGSSCVAPTGTLTSSNCSISAGNSTCSTSLNWSTSNPIGTSAVTTNYPTSGTTVSSQNSGTNVAYAIPYGSTVFYLYNNAIQLSQSTATASCANGTVWNAQDGKCQATTGTITATGCTINAGSSSCSSTISWSTLNPVETSIVKTSGGTTIATNNNGSMGYSVNPGTHTFNLWHYGKIIANATATAVCSSLSEWNGSICELKAPEIFIFMASQLNVVRGRPVTLVWESETDAVCTGTGFSTGGSYAGTVSVNPTVDTTYTLSCVRGTKTTTKSLNIRMLDIAINEQ